MREDLVRCVLIRNAGCSCAAAIARRYASEGWAVSLEISKDDTPGNDLVVEVWDAGGHIHVVESANRRVQDGRQGSQWRNNFDRVIDALNTEL